jgi:hypothetical protein
MHARHSLPSRLQLYQFAGIQPGHRALLRFSSISVSSVWVNIDYWIVFLVLFLFQLCDLDNQHHFLSLKVVRKGSESVARAESVYRLVTAQFDWKLNSFGRRFSEVPKFREKILSRLGFPR